MKVLTAPAAGQPLPDEGFAFTIPGELLCRPPVCDSGREGNCGCERSWSGVSSQKGTTVAVVTEQRITADEYTDVIGGHLGDAWACSSDAAEDEARMLADVASDFDLGALVIIELNGDTQSFHELVT